MKFFKDSHFMEALYVAFVAFCLVILSSCAHDPKLDSKIRNETAAQPTIDAAARADVVGKTIQDSTLNERQKSALAKIAHATSSDLKTYREQDAKLRLLLVKQLVNPDASDREIEGIKQRILELNRNSNKRWLSSLDDARQVIGRKARQDAWFYRALVAEPVSSENLDGGRTEK